MRKRIISAVVGISAIIAVILLSLRISICIDIFVACACTLSVFEFVKAVRTLNLYQISAVSLAFSFVYPMLVSYDVGKIICFVYTVLMMAMMVFCHSKISFKDFAYTFSMTLIITLSLSCVIRMKDADPISFFLLQPRGLRMQAAILSAVFSENTSFVPISVLRKP